MVLNLVNQETDNLSWRIGGPQGSGINRIARLFARACATQGAELICRREYHSNIMGRHSYNDILMGAKSAHCHRESTDILVSFDPETLARHALMVTDKGCVLHSSEDADVPLGRLAYLDERLREDLTRRLEAFNLPPSTGGLLQMINQKGVQSFAIPYGQLLTKLAEAVDKPRQWVAAAQNTLAASVSATLMSLAQETLEEAIETAFGGRKDLVELNHQAMLIAYNYTREHISWKGPSIPVNESPGERLLINATQGVALGKLAAGMGFQSYYPISPATDESTFLEAHAGAPLDNGQTSGPLIFQVEDELAAINMASGAALTGARSATSTSGPGFSLMSEGLGWAGMNEVPLVVTLYQRGGPSTGMPTRTDQGDLQFALNAGHGEFPRIILASGDVTSCFYDAAQAFDYAEHYQLPVIHLLDKALTSTLQTIPLPEPSQISIDRGERDIKSSQSLQGVKRFQLTDSGISPRPVLGDPNGQHWTTGVEHSEQGQVTEDPVLREAMMEKRARKLELAAAEIPVSEKLEILGDEASEFTLLTWGSNKGAVLDAMQRLADSGISARAVQLRLLWPLPADELMAILSESSPSVMIEANFSGQLNKLFQQQIGRGCDYVILKYSGRPISGEALFPALMDIHTGSAEPHIVLRNSFE